MNCAEPEFKKAEQTVERIFTKIENIFSPPFTDHTAPEVLELFQIAREIYQHSNGSFDITVAPLSEAWGFHSGEHMVPPPETIKASLDYVGLDKIQIKNESLKVPEKTRLDWGGIAKGWGIDLAYRELKKMNIPSGFINAGGDLYCWGRNPEQKNWQVGVMHPRQKGFMGVLSITDTAAATAGDYQRYFIKDGIRYHHIFDPSTGRPARGKKSVTVIGPQTAVCDGLATALFVSQNPEKILSRFPEYGAIVVLDNGDLIRMGRPYRFQPRK
ncbi:MAG: FAD:protein FMN transferase [Candidatus Aminicenantes bacterium]